jgi:DNA-directed RNA polymerase subunit RPC12/RpoP
MDESRKGKILYCSKCKRPTRHISETDRKEKLTYWACEVCGDWILWDKW